MTEQEKRILVLGSAPHPGTTETFKWEDMPQNLSIADYDVVILNLSSFKEDLFIKDHFHKLPKTTQVAELLFSDGGELLCLGEPFRKDGEDILSKWLPMIPKYSTRSGNEFRYMKHDYDFYSTHVKEWNYYFDPGQHTVSNTLNEFDRVLHPGKAISGRHLEREALWTTRFKREIAIQFRIKYNFSSSQDSYTSNALIWLPPPTAISPKEAIDLILANRYGVIYEQDEPKWIGEYELPNQRPVEEKILNTKNKIDELKSTLLLEKQNLRKERRFLKLLYETGDALEKIVLDALTELGAKVDKPEKTNLEDGRIEDPDGRHGMLEIKGVTGSASLKNVRQVNDWVQKAIVEEAWKGKGILIVNAFRNTPLKDRENPFPKNCIAAAKRVKVSMLTTADLFHAICSYQKGDWDPKSFWNQIFENDGVCNFST